MIESGTALNFAFALLWSLLSVGAFADHERGYGLGLTAAATWCLYFGLVSL